MKNPKTLKKHKTLHWNKNHHTPFTTHLVIDWLKNNPQGAISILHIWSYSDGIEKLTKIGSQKFPVGKRIVMQSHIMYHCCACRDVTSANIPTSFFNNYITSSINTLYHSPELELSIKSIIIFDLMFISIQSSAWIFFHNKFLHYIILEEFRHSFNSCNCLSSIGH